MRTSSMSSSTLLARVPAPQTQQQQAIGTGSVVNPGQNILGQLPTNPSLLKAAAGGGQNAAKMFNTNAMPAVGSMLNHRNTPPAMPQTFQFHPQRPQPNNPQQRIGLLNNFSPKPTPDMVSSLNNESDFPSLNTRSSPAPHTPVPNNIFGTSQFNSLQQSMNPNLYSQSAKDALNSLQQQHRMPYANMMRGVTDASGYGQTSEFSLHSEDFPALPNATQHQQLLQNSLNSNGGGTSTSNQTNSTESQFMASGQTNFGAQPNFCNVANTASMDFFSNGTNENGKDSKLNILINPSNGMISNIPPGILCDQYGIVGLLSFMKGLEQYPSLSALTIGLDITKLGLNMESTGNLYQNFGGPWSEHPCRIQDYEAKVPDEYLTNNIIRDKLPTIKVNKLSEDILFYLFYNCPGQVYQLAAASELYQRDWRYHKVDAVWLTRSVYGGMKEQTTEYETGSYNIFDPIQWRKVPKEMKLEYKMLESKPMPANPSINGPNLLNSNGGMTTPGQSTTPFAGTQQQNMVSSHFFKNI